jgi:hypothetical protein
MFTDDVTELKVLRRFVDGIGEVLATEGFVDDEHVQGILSTILVENGGFSLQDHVELVVRAMSPKL